MRDLKALSNTELAGLVNVVSLGRDDSTDAKITTITKEEQAFLKRLLAEVYQRLIQRED